MTPGTDPDTWTFTIPGHDAGFSSTITVTASDKAENTVTDDTLLLEWSILPATINIDPNPLNLGSQGKWITSYIEFIEPYDESDIDSKTVELHIDGHKIEASGKPTTIGDGLMIKFSREDVINALLAINVADGDDVPVTVKGGLKNSIITFIGSDTIRINLD
jgi:hypothetical protein